MGENLTFQASRSEKRSGETGQTETLMRVKTSRYEAFGLKVGDLLILLPVQHPDNGQLLVLQFDHRFFIRQVQLHEGYYLLTALDQRAAPIQWPAYKPLPVVGKVARLQREWRA